MTTEFPPPQQRAAERVKVLPAQLDDGQESTFSWANPDWSLIEDRRGDLPEFPLAVLDAKTRHWLERAAHGAGVTPAHIAVPLLSVTSSLIGAARKVRPSRAWREPTALWTALVGASGTGKTPGLDVSRRALVDIEKSRFDTVEDMRRDHEKRVAEAKAELKTWKDEVAKAITDGRPVPSKPKGADDIGPFVAPRFAVSDATIERLAILLTARPRGMLVISDELAGLFVNMARYTKGNDRPFWLEAWNGGLYVVERVNRPPVRIDHLLVGITGGFQPDKLDRAFAGDDDGMYARFLYSWPSEPTYRPLSNDVTDIEPEFKEALSRLINLPAGDGPILESRDISLSEEAVLVFEQFRKELHETKALLEGREREWYAKGEAQVLRLANTLVHVEWAMGGGDNTYAEEDQRGFSAVLKAATEPTEIGAKHIGNAQDLWRDYFWPHAQACLRQMGWSQSHRDSRRVLRWIKSARLRVVSREEIRREALNRKLDANQTEKILVQLVAAGWLQPLVHATGGRPARRWEVNLALFDESGGNGGKSDK